MRLVPALRGGDEAQDVAGDEFKPSLDGGGVLEDSLLLDVVARALASPDMLWKHFKSTKQRAREARKKQRTTKDEIEIQGKLFGTDHF
jgi:hypothetical protein